MKSICIEKPGSITIKESSIPKCSKGNALIKVKSVGICGSDITAYKGLNPTMVYPRIMGHELAGEIVEVESNDFGFTAGDRVSLEPYFYCGRCYPCRKGFFNNCENMNVLGVRMNGGMVEYIVHPIRYLHKLPNTMKWEQAAMIEPLSIALHSIHRTSVRGGEFIAIFGAGTIGLLAALICKVYGAKPILVDILDARLDFAQDMGIMHVLNSTNADNLEKIHKITKGDMCPVVLECSGAQDAINNALEFSSNSGSICLVGWAKGMIQFNQPRVLRKELNIFGSRNSYNEFPECIDLILSGQVDVMRLIDLRYSLENVMQGFKDLAETPAKYLKIVGLL
jgi:2-desacetyl-2-hydroxyethyl bacteriochlorophyllide A dehydrogenase